MRKFGVFLLVLAFLFTACSPVETDGEEQSTSADTTIAAEPIHITEIIIEESSASLGGDSEKILRYPVVVGEGKKSKGILCAFKIACYNYVFSHS